jgi:O-antigen ligase
MPVLHGLLLFWSATFLVIPNFHLFIPALLSLAGLFLARRVMRRSPVTDPDLRASWKAMLFGFAAFVLSGLCMNIYHGEVDGGAYERLLPFLLLPALAFTIRAGAWTPLAWMAAICLGSVMAAVYAVYDVTQSAGMRAQGATGDAIKFGNGAVVIATFCLLTTHLYPFEKHRIAWRIGLLSAAATAVFASLLSGSKGGWVALVVVAIAAGYTLGRRRSLLQRTGFAGAVLGTLLAVGFFAPSSLVRDRIAVSVNGAMLWVTSNGEVSDGSASLRFKLWELGLQIFAEHPIVGAGLSGKRERWDALVAVDPAREFIGVNTSAHNDFIEVLSEGGVVGAAGLALLYLGVWLAFWRLRHHQDSAILALARIGLMLVPIYLIFGLTVSVTGINFFRSIFITFSVTLLAFISVRQFQLENDETSRQRGMD